MVYEEELCALGDALDVDELPEEAVSLFEDYFRTGQRLPYENVYFERRRYLSILGSLSVLYGRQRDICRLEKVLESVCDERCWALPAHVNRENGDYRHEIDLFAAETAQTLAELARILKGKIDEKLRIRIVDEVCDRVITPFSENRFGWEQNLDNWNAVCCGCLGCAAADTGHLEIIDRVFDDIRHYMDGISSDGACQEGLHYWTYGMFYYILFLERMRDTAEFGERAGQLFSDAKLFKAAQFQQKCYMHGSRFVAFSDCERHEKYLPALVAKLGVLFPGKIWRPPVECALTVMETDCYRYAMILRSVLWQKEALGAGVFCDDLEGASVFPESQWAIYRGKDCAMAVKGGDNAEPHNHNDVGAFACILGGEELCTDPARGEYCADYFGEKRYEFLPTSSLGHCVPVVDGRGQKPGREMCADIFRADENGNVEISFAAAYGNPSLKSLVRRMHFDSKESILRVEDSFKSAAGLDIRERLVSFLPVKVCEGVVRIGDRGYLKVLNYSDCPKIGKQTYRDGSGKERTLWIIEWPVTGKSRFEFGTFKS
ncbi:MAG: heparinase II/III-family protein [Lachnospiraceae bacterium]|nr:heparinase II/III-family protein [Lachnospiraceae bacterium]